MELLCDRGVRKIFLEEFLYNNGLKRVPEKTGTSVKISVGRQDRTLNSLLLNFCKFDQKNLVTMQTVLL